jgi:hypothetical protein
MGKGLLFQGASFFGIFPFIPFGLLFAVHSLPAVAFGHSFASPLAA